MKAIQLFRDYEFLVDKAEKAYQKVAGEYPSCIRCERGCTDCCHAVFGLFHIEAAYIQFQFSALPLSIKAPALERCKETEKNLEALSRRLEEEREDPRKHVQALAIERVRCPLLDDKGDCILYSHRPMTCRIYGIPTYVQGKARVCGKAEFNQGKKYPVFDLDGTYRQLYHLSKELLGDSGCEDLERASLLISVAKTLKTSLENLMKGEFDTPDTGPSREKPNFSE
jgi:Fe-S-cluster containining protein